MIDRSLTDTQMGSSIDQLLIVIRGVIPLVHHPLMYD